MAEQKESKDAAPATPDLVAQTLESVRKSASGSPAKKSKRQRRSWSDGPQFSGSGPDDRDPSLLGVSMANLVRANGWEQKSKVGGVIGRWPSIVGHDLASHVTPESFDDKAGRLVLRAESTTWATQVRSLIPMLQQKMDDEIGPSIVREIEVRGPARKSRNYGPLRVKGRGDRDTYG